MMSNKGVKRICLQVITLINYHLPKLGITRIFNKIICIIYSISENNTFFFIWTYDHVRVDQQTW